MRELRIYKLPLPNVRWSVSLFNDPLQLPHKFRVLCRYIGCFSRVSLQVKQLPPGFLPKLADLHFHPLPVSHPDSQLASFFRILKIKEGMLALVATPQQRREE